MATQAGEDLLTIGSTEPRSRATDFMVRGTTAAMRAIERTVSDIASTNIPVLLVGESGTGKELVALQIHRLSKCGKQPFVKCGCAGMTGDSISALMQSADRRSELKAGTSGSLLLDGINHLDISAQARLLHLLPDGNGGPQQGSCTMRLISSTTRDLEQEMKAGNFREELYYRINGVKLQLPPLRDRTEDIPALLEYFLKKYASLFERPEPKVSDLTIEMLMRHTWPGNIRELENVVRKIVALGDEQVATHGLSAGFISKPATSAPIVEPSKEIVERNQASRPLKEAAREASRLAERSLILNQLERTHWNRKRAARDLQISYKALLYKLKQLGLDNPSRPEEK